MMEWNDHGGEIGGSYFNEQEATTPSGKWNSKSVIRQQFVCPVTIKQVLDAPNDGLKVGAIDAVMVSVTGIVVSVDVTSTKVKFTLSDDTGMVDCIEWVESDDGLRSKTRNDVVEKSYYQVYGSVKTVLGVRRIMVYRVLPIQNFNEYTAFLAEVIRFNQYAEKPCQLNQVTKIASENSYSSKSSFGSEPKTIFNPIQMAILEEIKVAENKNGWSKRNSPLNNRFSKKQIDDALDFLVSEGHIYSTVDDEHYCST